MRYLVFDIETTADVIESVFDPSTLELTVLGLYDSESGTYQSFLKEELAKAWPLFEKTDAIIGYNSDHFDIPVLNRYYPGDLAKLKSIDLLKDVRRSLGRRLKLDSIAEATLGRGKSGDGLQAMRWWKEGKVEEVRRYCLDDVRITKDIYEYAKKHRMLKYKDLGVVKEIPLDTSEWETSNGNSLTYTLPF